MSSKDTGTHYRKSYRGVKLDPARICSVYGVTNTIQAGIIKKALRAGTGSKKTVREDVEDIITGAQRWLEMMDEDEETKRMEEILK